MHGQGSKIAFQINPSRGRSDRVAPITVSDVPHPATGIKQEMVTVEEIQQIEEEFGQGVSRAKEVGADAIMIHGGSGYLISEFLSQRTNRRHDDYGGDLRKRARFALELIKITRDIVGLDYPILFRPTADERLDDGFALKDAIEVCKLLQDARVDAIDIVSGALESNEWINPDADRPRGFNVPLQKQLKRY